MRLYRKYITEAILIAWMTVSLAAAITNQTLAAVSALLAALYAYMAYKSK